MSSRGYDDWKTSPPEPEKVGTCAQCTEDIEEGNDIYLTGEDDLVHVDCFVDYAEAQLNAYKTVAAKGVPNDDDRGDTRAFDEPRD